MTPNHSSHRLDEAVLIRPARAVEADALTALVLRSKAHWGYPEDFLSAHRDTLTIDAWTIETCSVFVAEAHLSPDLEIPVAADAQAVDQVLGVGLVENLSPERAELGLLFVEPTHLGRGIGRRLLAHALECAREGGACELVVPSDPHALDFYTLNGAEHIGYEPSICVPGYTLPLLRFRIST